MTETTLAFDCTVYFPTSFEHGDVQGWLSNEWNLDRGIAYDEWHIHPRTGQYSADLRYL